jgi:hypothetical protein
VAERRQRCQKGQIQGRAAPLGGIQIFGEALPIPGDAPVQDRERNALDIDQVAHRDLARLGFAGRDAHAAIAHDDRGDAVPTRWADRRVPADLRVVMGVRVDEAGGDDEAGGVDRLCRAVADSADIGNPAAHDSDIGAASRGAGAVDNSSALDQQVVGHLFISSLRGAPNRIDRPAASQHSARKASSSGASPLPAAGHAAGDLRIDLATLGSPRHARGYCCRPGGRPACASARVRDAS